MELRATLKEDVPKYDCDGMGNAYSVLKGVMEGDSKSYKQGATKHAQVVVLKHWVLVLSK